MVLTMLLCGFVLRWNSFACGGCTSADARWLAVTNEETGKEELWDAAGVVGRAANATNQ
jgi:hypothetical protein